MSGATIVPAQAVEDGKVMCMGVNDCKGMGACKTASSSCKGMNSCKGHGWLELTKAECDEKGGTVGEG